MNTRPTYEPSDLLPQETGVFTKRPPAATASQQRPSDWAPDMPADPPPRSTPPRSSCRPQWRPSARRSSSPRPATRRGARTSARAASMSARHRVPPAWRRTCSSAGRGSQHHPVKVGVLIDASGSMAAADRCVSTRTTRPSEHHKTRHAGRGRVFGATIAKALGRCPPSTSTSTSTVPPVADDHQVPLGPRAHRSAVFNESITRDRWRRQRRRPRAVRGHRADAP